MRWFKAAVRFPESSVVSERQWQVAALDIVGTTVWGLWLLLPLSSPIPARFFLSTTHVLCAMLV